MYAQRVSLPCQGGYAAADSKKSGSESGWQHLVENNLPLVRALVRRQAERAARLDALDDLLQAGFFGLVESARRFCPDAAAVVAVSDGQRFRAFARPRIEGAVVDELRRMDWRPRRISLSAVRIARALSALEQKLGRPATERELACAMGLSLPDYQSQVLDIACGQLEELLEEPVADQGEGLAFLDGRDKQQHLAKAIAALPLAERQLLYFYYHQGLNLSEIAAVFGVTQARVCQLHKQALLRLRAQAWPDALCPGAAGRE